MTEATDGVAWNAFVRSQAEATGYQLWEWIALIQEDMKLQAIPLVAYQDGQICGVLPLVRQRLGPMQPTLISLPFVNYAGLLASSPEAEAALLEGAIARGRRLGVARIELRHVTPRAAPWGLRRDKVRFRLDVSRGRAEIWNALPGQRRTQTRRAQRDGLIATIGGAEYVDEFYRVIASKWHSYGTPVLPKRFFEGVLSRFPGDARICVVKAGRAATAAGFMYRFRDEVENPWLGSLDEYSPSRPSTLLCWTMIEESHRWGARFFDFGRSSRGSGPYRFKQAWGATEEALHWSVWPSGAAESPDSSPGAELVKRVWRKLPLAIANTLGPSLARQLPL